VRLRYAYFITCHEAVKNERGEIVELRCTTIRPRGAATRRRSHGQEHHALGLGRACLDRASALLRQSLHEPRADDVEEGKDVRDYLNPDAMQVQDGCRVEPALAALPVGVTCQFERQGYFCLDNVDSRPGALVFNRTVTLRDTWAKIEKKMQAGGE